MTGEAVEFGKEHEDFRREVVAYFQSEQRPEWLSIDPETDEYLAMGRAMDDKLRAKGWYTLHWPEKYGGRGGDPVQYAILREMLGYFRVPTYGGHGRYIIGPALVAFGTEEQKLKILPAISRGELTICLGFTEPDAGSDLGAMQTKAVRDGSDYVVTGSKIYITYGKYANTMLLAARTDPTAQKHRGVSTFLIDMKTPGIEIKHLECLTGHAIAEVHFDGARIPASTMVGEENRGFYNMAAALNFERSGVDRPAGYMAHLEEIAEYCRENGQWERPRVRYLIGMLASRLQAWRMICWRVVRLQSQDIVPSWEASLAQFYRKDFNPVFGEAMLEIFGPAALLERGDPDAILGGRIEWFLREGFDNHGQGGRFVTRNVIGRRGLGLPDVKISSVSKKGAQA